MLHPGAPFFLRLFRDEVLPAHAQGPNYPRVGKGRRGEKKCRRKEKKGNQGRSDTPCSFPTLGRRGANRSDQIHFPESIFCFVNTLGHPFPAHSFPPTLTLGSSCPFPAFKPPFFFLLEKCDDGCMCEQIGESWRGWQQVCKCAEILPECCGKGCRQQPTAKETSSLLQTWTTHCSTAPGLVRAAAALSKTPTPGPSGLPMLHAYAAGSTTASHQPRRSMGIKLKRQL